MDRFVKILVGVDLADETHLVSRRGLGERGANALAQATWIAAASGAELRIAHALPLGPRSHDLLRRHGAAAASSPAQLAEERLRELADGAREFGVRTSFKVLVGPPPRALLAEARDWGAGLIVLAGRDRECAVGLLGSTAARVFRSADIPVWIARRSTRRNMRDVLAAVTLDEHSHGVLRLAADTARRTGARLHALHVAGDAGPERVVPALEALEAWVRAHAADVCIGSVQVRGGVPSAEILDTAAAVGADAVFIGPSRRAALLARLGSGATSPLLKRLECSLVCARAVPGSPKWPVPSLSREALATS